MKLMDEGDKNQYTIQLFWTDNVQPDRMERFLIRAEKSVNLSDLYVHPENPNDMFLPDADGNIRHWILEIHFVDRQKKIGGFYEQLLT